MMSKNRNKRLHSLYQSIIKTAVVLILLATGVSPLTGTSVKASGSSPVWSQVTGLPAMGTYYLTITFSPSFGTDRTIFAGWMADGTNGRVYRSRNGGSTWEWLQTLPNGGLNCIVLSPNYHVDRTIFVSLYPVGVYRSTDDGASWQTVMVGGVIPLAISPNFVNDHTLFAGTVYGGVYRSTDSGNNWTLVGLQGLSPFSLAVSPTYASDRTVFCGTHSPGGIYRSTDGGNTWDTVYPDWHSNWNGTIAVSPDFSSDHTVSATVYIGRNTEHRVIRSTDSGKLNSWQTVLSDGTSNFWPIVVSPNYKIDHTVLAGAYPDPGGTSGVYLSVDGGNSWKQAGLSGRGIYGLGISPSFAIDGIVFAGSGGAVFRTALVADLSVPTNLSKVSTDNNPLPAFRWDAVPQASSYEVRVDSSTWQNVGLSKTYVQSSLLAKGQHLFAVRAVDEFGNPGVSGTLSFNVSVDSSLADTQIAFVSRRVRAKDTLLYVRDYGASTSTPLTVSSASDIFPRWSPTGDRLIFYNNDSGMWDMFRVDVKTKAVEKLVSAVESSASWSPDGLKIAYGSGGQLFVMNADGSSKEQLTTTGWNGHPEWSPDGEQIAFVSMADNPKGDIYIINLHDRMSRRLTTTVMASWPVWSPDGQEIAFQAIANGSWNICIVNAGGGEVRAITASPATDQFPSWSPDGSKIAFSSDRDGNGYEIYVVNRDGTEETRLTFDGLDYEQPSWSPYLAATGSPILEHIGNKSATEGQPLVFQVNTSDPDGRPLTFSTFNLPVGAQFDKASRTFSWTPATGQAGTYSGIRFIVSNGIQAAYEDISITVTPPQSAIGPRITAVEALYDGNPRSDVIGYFVSGVDMYNVFSATVWHASGAAEMAKVTFSLGSLTIEDTDPHDGWTARFNMGNLNNDGVLTVVATDKAGFLSNTVAVAIKVVPIPAWLRGSYSSGTGLGPWTWTHEFIADELAYTFTGKCDTGGSWGFDISNTAFFSGEQKTHSPVLTAWVKYYLDGHSEIGGSAGVQYKMFGGDADLTGEVRGTLAQGLVLAELTGSIEFSLEYQIPTPWSIPVPFFGNQGLVVVVSPQGQIEVTADLPPPERQLKFKDITLEGALEVGAKLVLGEEDLTVIPAYVEVYLLGKGSMVFAYDPLHDPALYIDSAEVSARGGIVGKFGWSWFAHEEFSAEIGPFTWDIYQSKEPPYLTRVPTTEGWTSSRLAPASTRSKSGPPTPGVVTNDGNPNDFPAIATKGDSATAVWVHTTDTGTPPQMNVYYSFWRDGGWTLAAPLETVAKMKLNPAVAYVGQNPLVVWVADAGNISTAGFTTWSSGLDLYYSMWTGDSWTSPQNITNNSFAEGMPSLASNGSQVMLTWVRDGDNDLNTTTDLELYYCLWDGTGWTAPAALTHDNVSDTSPSVAFSGNKAIVTWIRDVDSNTSTLSDRNVYFCTWDGSWADPAPVDASATRAFEPAVAFQTDGVPGVVWVGKTTGNGELSDVVYLSMWENGQWGKAVQVSDAQLWAKTPTLNFDSQGNTVVAWIGTGEGTGDLFYRVLDAKTGSWSPTKNLTNDSTVDWQLATGVIDNKAMLVWLKHNMDIIPGTDPPQVEVEADAVRFALRPVAADLSISQANIKVSNLQPAVGESVTITGTISNVGDLPSLATVVRFFDGDPASGGVQIGSDCPIDELAVSGSRDVSTTWKATCGNHHIYVLVLTSPGTEEITVDNNIAFVVLRVLPDLVVRGADLTLSNPNPSVGETVTIKAVIHNEGGANAANVIVRFFDGDPASGGVPIWSDQSTDRIDSGSSAYASVPYVVGVGTHQIFVSVDPDGNIEELKENNNMTSVTSTVLPDLAVNSSDITFGVENGQPFERVVIRVNIRNIGGDTASGVMIRVYRDNPLTGGLCIGEQTIASIGAGATATAIVPYLATPGECDIFAAVDPDGIIAEWKEDNDVASRSLICRAVTVGKIGEGMVSPSPGFHVYPDGTQLQLAAEPASGWYFSHWSGAISGNNGRMTMTIDGDKEIIANFAQQGATLVGAIIQNPSLYTGKTVTIIGKYRGWEAGHGTQPVTKSDWVLQDATGAIYVTGDAQGLNYPMDMGKGITVQGIVRLMNGQVYIEVGKTVPRR